MTHRFMLFSGAAAFLVAGLLAGCADPKAANKGNFQTALQTWFDAHPECVSLGYQPLKVQVDGYGKTGRIADALAKAGLVTGEEGVETNRAFGDQTTYKVIRYRPTAKARDAIREGENRFIGGTDLCFAHRQVDEITGFTEPGDAMGMTVSQVIYRYRLRDIAPWAGDPNLRGVVPAIGAKATASQREDKASLVLTNDGWVNALSLRK